jgi:hypothetical protein
MGMQVSTVGIGDFSGHDVDHSEELIQRLERNRSDAIAQRIQLATTRGVHMPILRRELGEGRASIGGMASAP